MKAGTIDHLALEQTRFPQLTRNPAREVVKTGDLAGDMFTEFALPPIAVLI